MHTEDGERTTQTYLLARKPARAAREGTRTAPRTLSLIMARVIVIASAAPVPVAGAGRGSPTAAGPTGHAMPRTPRPDGWRTAG
jgi:hypothetical protein